MSVGGHGGDTHTGMSEERRKLPPEHVAAITQNTPRGKQHFRAKRFVIDDMEFYILSDAAKMFGVSGKTVKARLLSDKFPTWRYE